MQAALSPIKLISFKLEIQAEEPLNESLRMAPSFIHKPSFTHYPYKPRKF